MILVVCTLGPGVFHPAIAVLTTLSKSVFGREVLSSQIGGTSEKKAVGNSIAARAEALVLLLPFLLVCMFGPRLRREGLHGRRWDTRASDSVRHGRQDFGRFSFCASVALTIRIAGGYRDYF